YTLALDDADDHRKRLGLIAGLLVVGIVAVWWTWPRSGAAAAVPPATEVHVNGQAAERWAIGTVIIIDGADRRTPLPVTGTESLVWPALIKDEQRAWWRTTALHPLQLCVPDALHRAAQVLELASSDAPTRRYILAPADPGRPDLLLHTCGSQSGAETRYGTLEGIVSHLDQPLGTPATVGARGPVLRVEGVDVLGGGQDPQLPPDNYRVVVRVIAPAAVDWAALAPRLVLQTGLSLIPSAPIAEPDGNEVVEIPYLAPAWQTPVEAAWSLTDPHTKAEVRWRVTLDPPGSRADVLRAALDITVAGRQASASGAVTVILQLRNTSATTVVLTQDDLVITQHDRPLPVPEPGAAGLAIKPLEARTLELPLREIDLAEDVIVRVGAAGFRLRFGVQEGGASRGSS
ncbi:MAG: hypothetical protein M3380_04625, partial [Chloroflexota bacterium]|nr:hypothetical protein [Chloroflexota bacterium]